MEAKRLALWFLSVVYYGGGLLTFAVGFIFWPEVIEDGRRMVAAIVTSGVIYTILTMFLQGGKVNNVNHNGC